MQLVAREWNGPALLVTACLPVEFGRAADALLALIDEHSPDLVIATGVAGGRTKVTPERIAVNLAGATIPDNVGVRPVDGAILAGGPDAYFTRLPMRDIMTGWWPLASPPKSHSAPSPSASEVLHQDHAV